MKTQQKTFSYWMYRIIRWLVWVFYPNVSVEGQENLPDEACIIVGNHSQMNGPIIGQLYFPGDPSIWCASQMMHIREVPQYAFEDFWRDKPKCLQWFYKLLSYIIAPFSACVFSNADTIAVYHDNRLLTTFRQTIYALEKGTNVIIFPEWREEYNHIVNRFQDRFIDVAKLHYKRNGQALKFVPMYIAPKLKKVYIGKPIQFVPETPMAEERKRISQYLMDQITEMAVKLPRHVVVPYTNMPRKQYPSNICEEANADEKARS